MRTAGHSNQTIILLYVLGIAATMLTGCRQTTYQEEEPLQEVRYEFGLPIDSFRIDTGYVNEGETLGGILKRKGATSRQLTGITVMPRSEFDARNIRPGKEYLSLYQTDTAGNEQLCYWIYKSSIREATVFHMKDSLHVEKLEKPVRTIEKTAEAVIEHSLWAAMTGNNLPTELALELSEIYAWTIDFFGLQKGDSIRVFYEEQYVDSVCIGIGKIYASDFYHGGKWLEAFYYETPQTRGYFDGDGVSLRKAFLKAPLNYKRISSRFTYARKHPIFKTVRPHTGVDYAAPAGTPVVTIGDGVVIEKGYKGGGGNTIKIRHNSTYTTAYLHLSKFEKNIAVGKRVEQGQVIGYVGSTGNSTGPHLDFRVWKGGTPIDPLKMVSPPVDPVPQAYKQEYDSIVNILREKLVTE